MVSYTILREQKSSLAIFPETGYRLLGHAIFNSPPPVKPDTLILSYTQAFTKNLHYPPAPTLKRNQISRERQAWGQKLAICLGVF